MRCYRCLTKCERSVDKCPECGCVAFVPLTFRPSWPPQFEEPCNGSTLCKAGCLGHLTTVPYLLGPMPPPPRLGLDPKPFYSGRRR